MRGWYAAAAVMLAACGGGDGPSAPAPVSVLIRLLTIQTDPRGVRVTVENVGGDGSFRVSQRDANGVVRCQSSASLISAGVRTTDSHACTASIAYVTVEVQDGANPVWRRSACAAMNAAEQDRCAGLPQ